MVPRASDGQVREAFARSRVTMEKEMIDRHLFGDVGLAVLLAIPTLALARPQPVSPQNAAAAPLAEKAADAEQTAVQRRYDLPN
jgi:hypothetical protein